MVELKWKMTPNPVELASVLPRPARNKALRIAMSAAAKVVRDAVVSFAPVGLGNLNKSIRIKIKNYNGGKEKDSNIWTAIVGPSKSFKRSAGRGTGRYIRPSRYAHLKEFGSKFVSPKKFLEPALASTLSQFYQTLQRKIGEVISAELAKNKK